MWGGGGGGYTLINVSHNEKLKEDEMIMQEFDLGNHLALIHYSICEKEGDYRGNIPFLDNYDAKEHYDATRIKV